MNRLAAALALVVFAGCCWPQENETLILKAARERMLSQNDAWFDDGDFLPIVTNQSAIVELDPMDEETLSNLEWMWFNVERTDMQWFVVRRFRMNNPAYVDAAYYEAKLYYTKKLYAKLPEIIEPALRGGKKQHDNMYRFLANAYDKLGYWEDSARVWGLFLAKNPTDLKGQASLKSVQEKLKKK